MKIILYFAVGGALLFANAWYLRSLYRAFLDDAMPDVIAPFEYIGVEDKDGAKGRVMAQLLAARLVSLQREVVEAEDALSKADAPPIAPPSGSAILPSPERVSPIELNARVIDVPRLELKVSGVDISGLFAWAYRGLAEGRAIKVIVHSPNGAALYTVAAHLDTPGLDDIWLVDVDATDLAVIEDVAVEILRQHTVRAQRIREAAGLDRKEFGNLIAALRRSAALNRRLQHGVEPTKGEYNEIVTKLEPLVNRTPRWRLLVELAAKAAENGGDLGKSLELSIRERKLFDDETSGKSLSDSEKAERAAIEKRVRRLEAATRPAVAPKLAAADNAAEYPLNLIGIPRGAAMKGKPRVAILGGTPLSEQLKALGGVIEMLDGSDEANGTADPMREHTGFAAAVVRKAAPNATLLFAPMRSSHGTASQADVLASLDRLLESKPDIVLIPLSIDRGDAGPAVRALLERSAPSTVVVVSAGNGGPDEPAQFDGSPLAKKILVADAIDSEGRRATFASLSETVVWAPGMNIPIDSVDASGKPVRQTQSGTTFSAALAAGIAARLKGEHGELDAAAIVDRLRRTSRPLVDGGPAVLQLDAALSPD